MSSSDVRRRALSLRKLSCWTPLLNGHSGENWITLMRWWWINWIFWKLDHAWECGNDKISTRNESSQFSASDHTERILETVYANVLLTSRGRDHVDTGMTSLTAVACEVRASACAMHCSRRMPHTAFAAISSVTLCNIARDIRDGK